MKARYYMKNIAFLITLLFFFYLTNGQTKDEFNNFQKSINKYKNYYRIGDTISTANYSFWDNNNFIDTVYLKKYQLIDTKFNKEKYWPKTLNDYHCSLMGQYRIKNIFLIVTYSTRTPAGDGNPILTFATFSERGEPKDLLRIDLLYTHDPEIETYSYISISPEFSIFTKETKREFKLDNEKGKLTLLNSASFVSLYTIDDYGYFKEIEKVRK